MAQAAMDGGKADEAMTGLSETAFFGAYYPQKMPQHSEDLCGHAGRAFLAPGVGHRHFCNVAPRSQSN